MDDNERNLRNKVSRGKFTAGFLFAMPGRSRLNYVAFVGLTALIGTGAFFAGRDFAAVDLSSRHAQRQAQEHAEYAEGYIDRTCNGLEGQRLAECAAEGATRSREYQNAEYDLQAQESMAIYARWMLWVTMFGTSTAWVGIYFVARTLQATEAGTKDANRAYIEVTGAELYWNRERPQRVTILFTALNSGKTPAKWFEVKSAASVISGAPSDIAPAAKLISRDARRWNGFSAEREQSFPLTDLVDREELAQAYMRDGVMIEVAGVLRYCTFFDEIFESEFLFTGVGLGPYIEEDRRTVDISRYSQIPGIPLSWLEKKEKPYKLSKTPSTKLRIYQIIKGGA